MTQIGGAVFLWFFEQFVFQDFEPLAPVNPVMQRDISCYETLVQMALLQALALRFPFQRFGAVVPSLSDNTAAEAGANRLFTFAFLFGAAFLDGVQVSHCDTFLENRTTQPTS